jgi:glutamyl-tRNA reductase
MRLLAIGLSHRTAPVELRECVDFSRAGLDVALEELSARRLGPEMVVLSTCNRAEIYGVVESDAAPQAITRFFSEYHGIDHSWVEGHLYRHEDADAVRHLFRVAAGLDSLVIGEPQILGQVKTAYAIAREHRATGPLLNRLFHSAFAVGKRVRTETGLGDGAVSVSYAAIALAKKILGDLRERSVLILGAGEMAKLTGIHLQGQQVRQLAIAGRTQQAAEALAAQVGGRAVPWSTLDSALGSADIVVTAIGAAEPVLDCGRIERVMRHRRTRPLFVIDIALPRDVDPAAGDLEQVFLYNIDDLRTIVNENLARRSTELERAEAIVAEEVNRFSSWRQSREIIPTLVALRQRFEAIRRAELTRLEPKLSALSPEARTRLDEITRLIVEKLLLTPTEQLKSVSDGRMRVRYADALNRLFRLAAEDKAESLSEDSETLDHRRFSS